MSTLDRIRSFYGDDTCQRVFDPLVADWQEERRRRGDSSLLTAKWRAALMTTMLGCLPRALAVKISSTLLIDATIRALAFGALGFALQWLFGAALGPRTGGRAWPPSFASTLPFMVIPAVLELSATPLLATYQRRLVAIDAGLVFALLALVAGGSLQIRAANVVAVFWLTWWAWRIANPRPKYAHVIMNRNAFMKALGVTAALLVSTWPLKWVVGAGFFTPYWPGDQLAGYVVGALVAMSMTKSPRPVNELKS